MTELRVFSIGAVEGIPALVYITLIAVFCIGTILLLWLKGWRRGLRCCAVILLAEWIFLVLGTCVIFRETGVECRISLIPLISYFDYGENSYFMEKAALNILNVALFIPIGILLKPAFCNNDNHNVNLNWKGIMVVGLLLSTAIEVLQFVFKKGLCEIDDVIHNVVGCMIGYGMYKLLKKTSKGTQRTNTERIDF